GAGSGIGLAGAQHLAAAGAHVVLSGRRGALVEEAAAALRKQGHQAEAAALDVADKAAVARVGADLLKRHGHVDILVNSAGTNLPKRGWSDMSAEGWDSVIQTNLNGAVYCIMAVLPAMRARRDGVIVNISSWAG